MSGKAPSQTERLSPAITGLLIAFVVVLVVFPLATITGSEFPGTDTAAMDAIAEIDPQVQPWFEPLWSPPSSQIESLLFALQAAVGGCVLGYCFAVKRGKRQRNRCREDTSTGEGFEG